MAADLKAGFNDGQSAWQLLICAHAGSGLCRETAQKVLRCDDNRFPSVLASVSAAEQKRTVLFGGRRWRVVTDGHSCSCERFVKNILLVSRLSLIIMEPLCRPRPCVCREILMFVMPARPGQRPVQCGCLSASSPPNVQGPPALCPCRDNAAAPCLHSARLAPAWASPVERCGCALLHPGKQDGDLCPPGPRPSPFLASGSGQPSVH